MIAAKSKLPTKIKKLFINEAVSLNLKIIHTPPAATPNPQAALKQEKISKITVVGILLANFII
jgi:hypothetical protein